MTNKIRYVERKHLDTEKWNGCILRSVNGLVYSHSEFLDAMSPEWYALVMNDYEAVMPLTWRRKYGIHYLYQPAFCQQTGITTNAQDENVVEQFLSCIPKKFRYWDIQLNAFNSPKIVKPDLRKNYLLSLASTGEELQNNYHRNAVRNIRKAKDENICVNENIPASVLLQLHLARFSGGNNITKNEYKSFENLLEQWSVSSKAIMIGAEDKNGKIIASSGYLMYKNRITFIMNGNDDESLTNGASFLLKDHIIRKYAGSPYILDFEGSDNEDFARFYRQFGAEMIEYYPRIIYNRLPWPLNLFRH